MSLNGGRNRLCGYETTAPLSMKDKLGCLGIALTIVINLAIGIAALWWAFS